MTKTFRDLRPGDKVWFVNDGNFTEQSPITVSSTRAEQKEHRIYFNTRKGSDSIWFNEHRNDLHLLDLSSIKTAIDDETVRLFCNESDYQRYRKAQGMKELFSLIAGAKNAVEQVKKFRQKNFADLNKNWLESEIIKLEKETA